MHYRSICITTFRSKCLPKDSWDTCKIRYKSGRDYNFFEALSRIWLPCNTSTAQEATTWLDQWINTARETKIPMLIKMANSLSAHRYGLLNWYDYSISTGPLEGTNNKIKTLQRQAYGFRDREFFKLKIFALYESKYALIG